MKILKLRGRYESQFVRITGMAVVFVEIGQEVHIVDGGLEVLSMKVSDRDILKVI